MARLNISPSELRSRASELESQRQQHLQTMQRLRVCINNLPDIWQGAAADEFIQKFASANNQFNSFSDTLEKYIQLIQKAADNAESVDNELLSKVHRIYSNFQK